MNYIITGDTEQGVELHFIDTATFTPFYRHTLRSRDLYTHSSGAVVRCYEYPEWHDYVRRLYVPGFYNTSDEKVFCVPWNHWPAVRAMLHIVVEAINNHEL